MGEPILVFDDDCGFCTWWAEYVAGRTDVRLVGYSDLEPPLRTRLPDGWERCSHLVTVDGVYSCGDSIERALLRTPRGAGLAPLVGLLRRVPGYAFLREWAYRRIAGNRVFWGRFVSRTPPRRREREDREGRGP